MSNVISKYLSAYGEHDHFEMPFRRYGYVLVIPAFQEDESFVLGLVSFMAQQSEPILVILIINHPTNASHTSVMANQTLVSIVSSYGEQCAQHRDATLVAVGLSDILLIGPRALDKAKGVGLARKIGSDFALRLIERGIVSCPIIFGTDADAILPPDYFLRARASLNQNPSATAFIYSFKHQLPKKMQNAVAMVLYEKRLWQYALGLCWAGSPYAFVSIGSTIAISARAYACVRGYPKLSAGEDFYVLNKLRKLGEVIALSGRHIMLSPRVSLRVPFGTGPALHSMLLGDPKDAPIFYHPEVFRYLRTALLRQRNIIAKTSLPNLRDIDSALIDRAMNSLKGFTGLNANLLTRTTLSDRLRAFDDWFDGFRTLKFIHFLKDERFPMQSYRNLRFSNGLLNRKRSG